MAIQRQILSESNLPSDSQVSGAVKLGLPCSLRMACDYRDCSLHQECRGSACQILAIRALRFDESERRHGRTLS